MLLLAHHIIPRSVYGELGVMEDHHPDNLACLCSECHDAIPKEVRRDPPAFEEWLRVRRMHGRSLHPRVLRAPRAWPKKGERERERSPGNVSDKFQLRLDAEHDAALKALAALDGMTVSTYVREAIRTEAEQRLGVSLPPVRRPGRVPRKRAA